MACATPEDILFFAVVDFEATCDNVKKFKTQEIIEFPCVLLRWNRSGDEIVKVKQMQTFVKPKRQPLLTPFCTELTGITQDQVDTGVSFPEALEGFRAFLTATSGMVLEGAGKNVHVVTCGDWDCKIMLPKQCKVCDKMPIPAFLKTWINIKKIFPRILPKTGKCYGMTDMLSKLGMELEGRHHSGIDDCNNIARVLIELIQKKGGGDEFEKATTRE